MRERRSSTQQSRLTADTLSEMVLLSNVNSGTPLLDICR